MRLDPEYLAARALLAFFRALGPVRASDAGGAIARAIGPLLAVSRVAERNLRAALPALDAAARAAIIRAVWDNLGRTVGELPHLAALDLSAAGPGFEIDGAEYLRHGPAVYVSAHYGNWEVLPVIAARLGVPLSSIYRAAKNRRVDALIQSLRIAAIRTDAPMFPKGAAGARGAYAYLRQGGALGMLVDQKLNDGIEATLLGLPAMTAPAAAAFALRFACPVIPTRVERPGPARLRLVVEPPLAFTPTGDRAADTLALTQAINDRLGAWIAAKPGAWLWLHRRWPKSATP